MEQTEKKYAAIVLRNVRNGADSVDYTPVADALLSGGVLLDEIVMLSYEQGEAVAAALSRLSAAYDGVFVVCDKILIKYVRNLFSQIAGTSQGDFFETENCLYAVLPAGGKGAEIARAALVPLIDQRRGRRFDRVVLRTVYAPAEAVLSAISEAQNAAEGAVLIHTGESFGCQRVEVIYDQLTPKMKTDEVVRILANGLKDYLYAMEDVTVAEQLAKTLDLHRYRIATAESFTGGGVGKALVGIPGASRFFYEGINAYHNDSKQKRLGVTDYTLKTKGAVSGETAYEMAAGLLKEGVCDVAVATTGIAGPSSDDTKKPVGLCYIAVGTSERVRVFEYHLDGTREEITKTAVNLALFLTYKEINIKMFQ